MALLERRLSENVGDDFYVDASCIDCDACRQIAPATFRDAGEYSVVYRQPETGEETLDALKALVACPTASIGVMKKHDMRAGIDAFPSLIDENIYFSSFGAWSYLVLRPEDKGGNVLVDSPRYATQLVKKIEAAGSIRTLFLTHRDDVADHERFARKFSLKRIMHERDGAARYNVERLIEGDEPVRLDDDLTIIPVPGHTRGHMVLLYRDKYLFTGDHLAWSPVRETLTAFRNACWYSWKEQTRSMERLLDYSFEWVLPGHGRIHRDTSRGMRAALERCIEWMRATP
jgi:glyoxylase-like metal-dependent hydrolase (beta-lactamase superfamily II)/ferredoxin